MAEWETTAEGVTDAIVDAPEIKVFSKWSLADIEVSDISLVVRSLFLYIFFNF